MRLVGMTFWYRPWLPVPVQREPTRPPMPGYTAAPTGGGEVSQPANSQGQGGVYRG